ncbi:hypothetical protein [Salibacterium lacus]|uniref:Uncharacterized protein n=1 Tax=Salibacterium lacus TaxID=1898109 RepID=A0ABW5SZT1_9BACI
MFRAILLLSLGAVVLAAIPWYAEVFHTGVYYTMLVPLMGVAGLGIYWREALEKRFYKRWKRERKQKAGWIIWKETIRSAVLMFVTISLGFFMVEGLLPTQILYIMVTNVPALFVFLVVNTTVGLVNRFENEKRYNRLVDKWMDQGRTLPTSGGRA